MFVGGCSGLPPSAKLSSASKPASAQPSAAPDPGPDAGAARLFPSASADWLYTAPSGSGLDISSITSTIDFGVNTPQGGFDFP
ncbi:MAG: hypothetical protein ACRD1F_05470, partial [Terriglobales bacterium]